MRCAITEVVKFVRSGSGGFVSIICLRDALRELSVPVYDLQTKEILFRMQVS